MKKRIYWIDSLLLIFIFIMIMVILNKTGNIDSYIYNLVTNNLSDSGVTFWKYVTFLGSTKFIISLCVIFLILFITIKKKWIGIYITLSLILSTIVNNLLKIIIARDRPDVTRYVVETSYSFPSGHAMASTMLYGIISYFIYKSNINKYFKILFISLLVIIILMVSISRIYLGAHFVSDVISGIILSSILLLIIISIMEKRRRV